MSMMNHDPEWLLKNNNLSSCSKVTIMNISIVPTESVWQFRWLLFVLSGLVFTLRSAVPFIFPQPWLRLRHGPGHYQVSALNEWLRLRGLGRGQLANHWPLILYSGWQHACTALHCLTFSMDQRAWMEHRAPVPILPVNPRLVKLI